jgi:hypothetical protein
MKNSTIALNSASNTLQNKLSKIVTESVSPLSVNAQCRLALRALIIEASNRMVLEERVADDDVARASANLKRFIHEMKVESVFLGHAEELKYDSFRAARERMERHAVVTSFTLWPFLPSAFAAGNKRPN